MKYDKIISDLDSIKGCCRFKGDCRGCNACYTTNVVEELLEKLAYYEDLEEQKLLLELPYPVGTTLFIPCRKQEVKQDHIRRWQTNNKGLMFCSNGSFYLADAIGKSVFLTREEAEDKLKQCKYDVCASNVKR